MFKRDQERTTEILAAATTPNVFSVDDALVQTKLVRKLIRESNDMIENPDYEHGMMHTNKYPTCYTIKMPVSSKCVADKLAETINGLLGHEVRYVSWSGPISRSAIRDKRSVIVRIPLQQAC